MRARWNPDDERGLRATIAEAARARADVFCQYVLRDEETGGRVHLAPMHCAWHQLMDNHRMVEIWAHVEAGKSQQCSIGRVLWAIGRNPNLRVLVVSNTKDQAAKIVSTLQRYVERSGELREVFPDLRRGPLWQTFKFTVGNRTSLAKDPTVQAAGVHGNVLGARVDLLILDDVLDVENTYTKSARDKVWTWLLAEVLNRLTGNSRMVVVGTAFHPDDAMHRLAKLPGITAVRYPVLDPETQRPRWPERWPMERVQEVAERLGPLESARALFCKARDDAASRFKEEYIAIGLRNGNGKQLCGALSSVPPGYRTITGWDLAVQQHASADLTAAFTIAVRPDGQREVLNVEAGRWDGPTIVAKMFDHHRRYQSIQIVENNAAQDFVLQFARSAGALPMRPFTTGRNKAHPEFGVESLSAEMAMGKWTIPNVDGQLHPEVEAWINEMLYYDPRAHTGDRLMACLAPGARITTARGLVGIENVRSGDLVLTHRGRFRRVSGTARRSYAGDMVELKPAGTPSLLVTPEHPVWAAPPRFRRDDRSNRLEPGEWSWRDAGELRAGRKAEGDFVLAPAFDEWPDAASTTIDLAAFIGRRELAWGGRWRISADELSWRGERAYPRWLRVDRDAALLLGLYLAEGWIAGGHQVCLAFHRRETHLAEFAATQLDRLFSARAVVRTRKGHGGMTVAASSVLASRLLASLGKRDDKGLPWDWMGWPLPLRLAVVRGWLMGDGHVARNRGGRHLVAVSISPAIIYQAQLALWQAELLPMTDPFPQAATFRGEPCGHRLATRLRLSCRDSAALLSEASEIEKAHWGAWPAPGRDRTHSRALPVPIGAALRLATVTVREGYDGPIYNLHVEDDESFVANGVAVHNSWFAREGVRMGEIKAEVGKLNLMRR
jgi:hypothetical protein